MALTAFQQRICRLIADSRIANGESYVAGGAALNAALGASRISRDLDLFHDTESALAQTWEQDRRLLEEHHYVLEVLRERPSYVEAIVSREGELVLLQWARDSAFRFFPLIEHPIFGLTLHPFDLATNKVLALAGRLEVRDWIDVIECHRRLQPLGYLAWAACGKDPGFSPQAILEEARRSSRYSAAEVAALAFEGPPPDARELALAWRQILDEAESLVSLLPHQHAGEAVLNRQGDLFSGAISTLQEALKRCELTFHAGVIRGAYPEIKEDL